MSSISIELLHKDRIMRAFKNSPKKLAKAIQTALEQTGLETVGKVKRIVSAGTGMYKAPVASGTMRDNIFLSEKTPMRVVIEPNMSITPYAQYIITGTRRMRARPYLDITVEREGKNIQSFFKRTMDNFIEDLANDIG